MTAILDNSTDVARLPGGRRRVRTFAARRYWRTGGRWRAIDADLTVEAGDDGGYVVRLGEAAIRLAPATEGDRKALASATKRRVTNKRRFGPVLNAKHLPKALRFELVTEGDVTETPAGPAFAADDDRALGCFLRKWTRRLGGRMSVDHPGRGRGRRTITLDLDGLFADRDGELDLDPETVLPTDQKHVRVDLPTFLGWEFARNYSGGEVTVQEDVAWIAATHNSTYGNRIARTAVRFDTSGWPADQVEACRLVMRTVNQVHDDLTPHLSRCDFADVIGATAYYEANAYGFDFEPAGGYPRRVGDLIGDGPDSEWRSADMVASGHYAPAAMFDLALADATYDIANVQPPDDDANRTTAFDPTATHLEILLAGSAATPIHALAGRPAGGLC